MANNTLNKAKCYRLFGITRDFWESSLYCSPKLPRYEYEGNAHPYQEYLADLKIQRVFIEKQLKKLLDSKLLNRIDEAIEKIEPLAVEELLGSKYNGK